LIGYSSSVVTVGLSSLVHHKEYKEEECGVNAADSQSDVADLGDVSSCDVDYFHEPVVDDDVLGAAAAQSGVRVDFVLFPSEGVVSTEGVHDHKCGENELDCDVD